MKAVILSGGKGMRLAPITTNFPKQLVPVCGKPILVHCLEYLQRADIKEVAIILSVQTGHMIEETLKNYNFSLSIEYIYQDEPLGLAHAVNLAKDFVADDDFIMLLGDNLFDKELKPMIDDFYAKKSDSAILLKDVTHPYDFGVVKFDENGKAVKLVEKPKEFVSNYAIVGVYIFKNLIFDAISKIKPSARGELEITDAIAYQVEEGKNVTISKLESYWYDTGSKKGLLDANKMHLITIKKVDNINSNIRNSHLLGKVNVEEGSIIDNSSLMGPIHIGKNVKIIDSIIGPYTSVSDNTVVINSEVQSSILMNDLEVKDSQVIDSVIFKEMKINNESLVIDSIKAPEKTLVKN